MATPSSRKPPDLLQQPVGLRFGERGGRFVEDDDLDRVRGQHLGDLDELLGRGGETLDDGVRADVVQAEPVEDACGTGCSGRRSGPSRTATDSRPMNMFSPTDRCGSRLSSW